MKTPDQIIKEHISCTCDEMYKSRGLTDPSCIYCEYGGEIELMMQEYEKELRKEFNKERRLACVEAYKSKEKYLVNKKYLGN